MRDQLPLGLMLAASFLTLLGVVIGWRAALQARSLATERVLSQRNALERPATTGPVIASLRIGSRRVPLPAPNDPAFDIVIDKLVQELADVKAAKPQRRHDIIRGQFIREPRALEAALAGLRTTPKATIRRWTVVKTVVLKGSILSTTDRARVIVKMEGTLAADGPDKKTRPFAGDAS